MEKKLTFMKGEEFVRKILSGERNFSDINLEQDFDLCGDEKFEEMQKYLKNTDLEENPVIVENSVFRRLDADELYLPFLRADNASFKHAALMGADLKGSQFENTNFRYARLAKANMMDSNLKNADLQLADLNLASLINTILTGADFSGADLQYTNMRKADIKGIKNLELARFAETVNFQFADLTEKEKSIIRNELWAQQSKKSRLFGGAG
jgi:uncharacterized protein YjbI with pentapeptide repeats